MSRMNGENAAASIPARGPCTRRKYAFPLYYCICILYNMHAININMYIDMHMEVV